jgi:hypothetical protein
MAQALAEAALRQLSLPPLLLWLDFVLDASYIRNASVARVDDILRNEVRELSQTL